MLDLLLGDLVPYLIGAVLALFGIWGYGRKREIDGFNKGREKMMEDDRREATRTVERINEARDADHGDKSAADRLREAGRLRD